MNRRPARFPNTCLSASKRAWSATKRARLEGRACTGTTGSNVASPGCVLTVSSDGGDPRPPWALFSLSHPDCKHRPVRAVVVPRRKRRALRRHHAYSLRLSGRKNAPRTIEAIVLDWPRPLLTSALAIVLAVGFGAGSAAKLSLPDVSDKGSSAEKSRRVPDMHAGACSPTWGDPQGTATLEGGSPESPTM